MAQTQAFIGEVYSVVVAAAATGLTDLKLKVVQPDGSQLGADITMNQMGATNYYSCDVAATVAGSHVLELISPTETAIDGRVDILVVVPTSKSDMAGSGFVSADDSNKAISDKVDTLIASSAGSANGFVGK